MKGKSKKTLDKIIMGAVIGGAIGSVLGATIAPKDGKTTREEIKKEIKEVTSQGKGFFSKIKNFFKKESKTPESNDRDLKMIPTETPNHSKHPHELQK